MTFPFGITVTVQHQTEDGFGNFVTSTTEQVGPCAIDYTASSESSPTGQPSDTVSRDAILYAPPGANIVATDRVLLPDGSRWSAIGHTADFLNPFTGWHPGITVRLQQVSG